MKFVRCVLPAVGSLIWACGTPGGPPPHDGAVDALNDGNTRTDARTDAQDSGVSSDVGIDVAHQPDATVGIDVVDTVTVGIDVVDTVTIGIDAVDTRTGVDSGTVTDTRPPTDTGTTTGTSPVIAGCQILPSNHIFNTPINTLPVHPNSAAYLATIGSHHVHLDLGATVDQTSATFYGIPYNVVHGSTLTWTANYFRSTDTGLSWDARAEADCALPTGHTLVSPCTLAAAPNPVFPFPTAPIVEGGIDTNPTQPYGDHHILVLDADTCRLWETYHSYPHTGGGWDIYGEATFDMHSNALRPAGWTSADAAGFPMLPLLLRGDEATAGAIHHALRFTITSSKIRDTYVWPARHLTGSTTSTNNPQMGQLFRLRATYAIPASFNTQARAIVVAMQTYGMYIADGGSDMYVTGEPYAGWLDATISQVQTLTTADFEAVDITAITSRPGFDVNSGAVP